MWLLSCINRARATFYEVESMRLDIFFSAVDCSRDALKVAELGNIVMGQACALWAD